MDCLGISDLWQVRGNPEHWTKCCIYTSILKKYAKTMGRLLKPTENHGGHWTTWFFATCFINVSKRTHHLINKSFHQTCHERSGQLWANTFDGGWTKRELHIWCVFLWCFFPTGISYLLGFSCFFGECTFFFLMNHGWLGDPGCQTWQWVRDAKIRWKFEEIHMKFVVIRCYNPRLIWME